jgi:predicted nucleic acid-binding protein
MIESARIKARVAIALADCFAIATATALNATLLTGDPEIIDVDACPCDVEDLRLAP